VNALIVSCLILALPAVESRAPAGAGAFQGVARKTLAAALPAVLLLAVCFTAAVRAVYGDQHDGYGNRNLRFGPNADWKVRPILTSQAHR